MQSENLLDVSERIYHGIRDIETTRRQYDPLWKHPLILEALLCALRTNDDTHRKNFETICDLICPDFLSDIKSLTSFKLN